MICPVFVTFRLYIKSIEYHTMKSSMIYAPYVPLSLTHARAHAHTHTPGDLQNAHMFSFWTDLCHVYSQILSVQQLYRICTLYWDDNYNTRSVSPDVSF